MSKVLSPKDFAKIMQKYLKAMKHGEIFIIPDDTLYAWDDSSTYIKEAPFFYNISDEQNR
jgi:aconitate hydratase